MVADRHLWIVDHRLLGFLRSRPLAVIFGKQSVPAGAAATAGMCLPRVCDRAASKLDR